MKHLHGSNAAAAPSEGGRDVSPGQSCGEAGSCQCLQRRTRGGVADSRVWIWAGRSQGTGTLLLPALVLALRLQCPLHFTSPCFSSSFYLLFVIFSEQDHLLIHVFAVTCTMKPWYCLRPLVMTVIQMINHHHKTGQDKSRTPVITQGWSVSSSQICDKVRETTKGQKKWMLTEKRRCWMALKYF